MIKLDYAIKLYLEDRPSLEVTQDDLSLIAKHMKAYAQYKVEDEDGVIDCCVRLSSGKVIYIDTVCVLDNLSKIESNSTLKEQTVLSFRDVEDSMHSCECVDVVLPKSEGELWGILPTLSDEDILKVCDVRVVKIPTAKEPLIDPNNENFIKVYQVKLRNVSAKCVKFEVLFKYKQNADSFIEEFVDSCKAQFIVAKDKYENDNIDRYNIERRASGNVADFCDFIYQDGDFVLNTRVYRNKKTLDFINDDGATDKYLKSEISVSEIIVPESMFNGGDVYSKYRLNLIDELFGF